MCKSKVFTFIISLLFVVSNPFHAFCDVVNITKLPNGIIVNLRNPSDDGAKKIKIQVISDNIIRIVASPTDTFSTQKSLMIDDKQWNEVKWFVKETSEKITVGTSQINAIVSVSNGKIVFTDKNGNILLAEKDKGAKKFNLFVAEGQPLFHIKQTFASNNDDAFYGLGQHQNGLMNYKDQQVDLSQYNTDVAVPFLVTNKHYGILWDNYSITKVIDSREYEELSTLKLFSADGNQGWLTATYYNDSLAEKKIIERPESEINYNYLGSDLKNLPEGFKAYKGYAEWNGSFESGFTGVHKLFFRYAGYAKLFVDGKLVADRWRQTWNPGSAIIELNLIKNTKHTIKIEWKPDGTESFISCKWMKPAQGEEASEYSFKSEAGIQIDYYFVYGKSMDDLIAGYRNLTGAATLMPKWAMGLWQSRQRYKTQDEILQTVAEFRKRNIPLDNIVLDWNYWEQDKWGSQEFDKSRFPDAEAMIKTLHEKYNAHFMISVWPKFYEGIDNYKYFDSKGWLYKRNIANGQRDWIAQGYVSTFYDAYNDEAKKAFWDIINKNLFSKGVDAWWLDASEPDVCSNLDITKRKSLMTPNALGSSTQYFNDYAVQNAKAVYEGQRNEKPNQRVFILTRSAYAGIQRYASATWSGDIGARWSDLKNQIPAGINFSLSGLPYWTTDIGGFAVEHRYENAKGKDLQEWRELMTRWYQFGTFCPLFRVHGEFPYREIYNVAPENHPAYKSMLYYDKLRYRLMPYIYSLAGKTYHENYTIMRGLVMDFANDPKVKNIGDQFMFGQSILVSPVTDFNATTKEVYLPASTGWFDFYSGKYFNGGQQIVANAPLERIPLFVKEGSVIPFGPAMQYSTEKSADTITLYVYTGKDANFTIYEDENINYNYEKGKYTNIPLVYNEQTKMLTIAKRKGEFDGMLKERTFKIIWIDKNKNIGFDMDRTPDVAVKYNGDKIFIQHK
ncbi:MAG: DUF4968 domain-containing protein [Bacteroidota bacterium]|nr:DUF4968 domain-containing protein [Bacteroidota bacterium]